MNPRDPLEVTFTLVLLVSTLIEVLTHTAINSVTMDLPDWARIAWMVTLICGCVLVLAGVFWHEPVTGLFVESVGLSAVSSSIVAYSVGIVAVDGEPAIVPALLTLVIGVGYGWKYWQVRRLIRGLPR